MSNWHNVLRAINMASCKSLFLGKLNNGRLLTTAYKPNLPNPKLVQRRARKRCLRLSSESRQNTPLRCKLKQRLQRTLKSDTKHHTSIAGTKKILPALQFIPQTAQGGKGSHRMSASKRFKLDWFQHPHYSQHLGAKRDIDQPW